MKLVSFEIGGTPRFGYLHDRMVYDVAGSLIEFLGSEGAPCDEIRGRVVASRGAAYPAASVRLLPPVPNPRKLLCIASNYLEHILECGEDRVHNFSRVTPQLFLKPPSTTLRGPDQELALPWVSTSVDWEVELAVVIGRRARYIGVEDAKDYILGYTILNDISERDLNIKPKSEREERAWDPYFDWFGGKIMDGFAPMGPVIVTADEIPNPNNLHLSLRLNGEIMQDSSTAAMMSSVPEIVSYVSYILTLEPGDVIATGTPHGVGLARGVYLKPGDVLEASIESIGVLRTPVVAETPRPGVKRFGS